MSRYSLTTRQGAQLNVASEHRSIADVVRTSYPIRSARTYIRRHLGNPIQIQLVEIVRGEEQGCVRMAEIVSADGGPRVFIRLVKTLPDGTPASFFAPKELVQSRVQIESEDGDSVPALRTRDKIILHVPVHSYLRFLPNLYRAN